MVLTLETHLIYFWNNTIYILQINAAESFGSLFKNLFLCPGPLPQPEVVDNGDGTFNVSYTPPAEGTVVKAVVKHNDKEIPQRFVQDNFLRNTYSYYTGRLLKVFQ